MKILGDFMKFIYRRLLILCFFVLLILPLSLASVMVIKTTTPAVLFAAIAKTYYNQNDFDNAVKYFQKSLQHGQMPGTYHNLGIAYYRKGDIGEAISSIDNALMLNENYPKADYSLGLINFENGDFDKSILNFEKVLETDMNNANAHFDLAVAYVERFRSKETKGNIFMGDLDDLKEAIVHYKKADELKPGFSNALGNAQIVEEVIQEYKKYNS